MSAVLSNSIVIIAIVVSACYAVWRLGPRKMRDAVRMRLAQGDAERVRQSQRQLIGRRLRCLRRWLRADNEDRGPRLAKNTRFSGAKIRALNFRTSVPAEAAAPPATE